MKNFLPLILLLASILIFFTHPFEGSGDFYHHVNTGRFIAENYSLPQIDSWTHTAKNEPWVAHSWGSGLLFYLLLSYFGEISISLLSSVVAVWTFALLYILLRAYTVPKWPAILTLAITAPLVASRWPQRPEIFEYPFILLLLIIDAKKPKYPKLMFLLPIIILVWANIYGSSVLFGLLLLGLLNIKQLVFDRFDFKRNLSFYLVSLTALCLSLFNGYGFKTIFYFNLYIPKVASYEGEWSGILRIITQMPASQLVTLQYYILIYFGYLLMFLILVLCSWKIIRKNLFLAFLGLAIFAPFLVFRNLPLAAILSAPILALCLNYHSQNKRRWLLVLPIIFLVLTISISLWLNAPKISTSPNQPAELMIEFLKQHRISGKALNMGHFGGFLTNRLHPNVLVFFDTRDELFTNSPALTDLYDTYSSGKSVLPLTDKYQVNLVIGDYLADGLNYRDLFYSLDWSLVYLNDRYFVLIPTKEARSKNIIVLNYLDPFSATAAKPGHEEEAAKYYQQLLKKDPNSLTNKLFLSSALSALGRFDQVIEIAQSLEVDQDSPVGPIMEHDKNVLLADAYIEKNDCANGKQYLDKANQPIRPVLLFSKSQSNQPSKQLAKYFLLCEKDANQASSYLNQFLINPQYTPLEKATFRKRFDGLNLNR